SFIMFTLSTSYLLSIVFFFSAPATPETYTLSLHDALPIFSAGGSASRKGCDLSRAEAGGADYVPGVDGRQQASPSGFPGAARRLDRKSTRLNSSHRTISYAVFCLKKKKKNKKTICNKHHLS